MGKNFRYLQIPLAVFFSLFFMITSAVDNYYDLADADFLSSTLVFENPDPAALEANCHQDLKSFFSLDFTGCFVSITPCCDLSIYFPLQMSSPHQENFVLRC